MSEMGTDPVRACPRVGVVVLNYENAEDTEVCVATLQEVRYQPLDVIVVDNASSAECYRRLEALAAATPGMVLARSERNGGYAAGNNVGIRIALERGAEYVLVLNNDALAPPDALVAPLVAAMEADPRVMIAGPRILSTEGADQTPRLVRPTYGSYFLRFGLLSQLRRRLGREPAPPPPPWEGAVGPVPVEVPCGSCMMLRPSFLCDIGLLDEGTFLYQEEVILTEQVRRRGGTVVIVPEARVTHLVGRTTSRYRLRRAVALWRSQSYYLGTYRGVGPVRRSVLFGYQAASYGLMQASGSAARLLRRVVRRG
jgi:GT2 family glycosyltransferase